MFVVIVRVRPGHLDAWRRVAEARVIEHRNTFCHPVSLQGQAT
ncbi:hypothetical protein ACIBQ1_35275 [Nonomuraea sp. NPDC050153]